MAGDLINARDWIFEAETTTPATYVEIGGIEEFTLNLGENEEEVDTTLFEDQGQYSSQPIQRGATIELTGKMKIATGDTPDPGQLRIDTLGAALTEAALFKFRFRHTIQENWSVWASAWVTPGEKGGGTNDKTSWGATIHRDGPGTTVAVS